MHKTTLQKGGPFRLQNSAFFCILCMLLKKTLLSSTKVIYASVVKWIYSASAPWRSPQQRLGLTAPGCPFFKKASFSSTKVIYASVVKWI